MHSQFQMLDQHVTWMCGEVSSHQESVHKLTRQEREYVPLGSRNKGDLLRPGAVTTLLESGESRFALVSHQKAMDSVGNGQVVSSPRNTASLPSSRVPQSCEG